jgi:hypothetical protein
LIIAAVFILWFLISGLDRQTGSTPAVVVMANQPADDTGPGCASVFLTILFLLTLIDDVVIFPPLSGGIAKPQPWLVRSQGNFDDQVPNDSASQYRTIRCTKRCPAEQQPA